MVRGLGILAVASPLVAANDQILTPWDLQQGDAFGSSIDLADDWMLVGSPRDDIQGLDSGSVSAFHSNFRGWVQKDLLKAPDGRPGDRFGASVAISGDLCAIGAPQSGTRGWRAGAVHLFHRKGEVWAHSQTLYAPNGAPGDNFGHALDLHGNTLVVGARFADGRESDSGAAYIFGPPLASDKALEGGLADEGKLVFHQRLRAPSEHPSGEFGFAVSVFGETIAIGSWGARREDVACGSVYLYTREQEAWHLHRELWAPVPQDGACFGLSVQLSESRCAIGAPWENHEMNHAGGAYVWARGHAGWEMEEHLKPRKPMPEGCFGISMSLDPEGNRLLVGSRRGSPEVPGAGAASFYEWQGKRWNERRFWQAPVPRAGDDFGLALVINSSQALICARRGNSDGGAGHGGCLFLKVLAPK